MPRTRAFVCRAWPKFHGPSGPTPLGGLALAPSPREPADVSPPWAKWRPRAGALRNARAPSSRQQSRRRRKRPRAGPPGTWVSITSLGRSAYAFSATASRIALLHCARRRWGRMFTDFSSTSSFRPISRPPMSLLGCPSSRVLSSAPSSP
eukprot:2388836-Pyramimonas_sp.AAC.1